MYSFFDLPSDNMSIKRIGVQQRFLLLCFLKYENSTKLRKIVVLHSVEWRSDLMI